MAIKFFEGFETVGTDTGLAFEADVRPRVDQRFDSTASGSNKSTDSFYLMDDAFTEGYALNMGTNGSFSQANNLRWLVDEADYDNPADEEFSFWTIGFRYHVPSSTATWTLLVIRGLFGGTNETDVLTMSIIDSTDIRVSRADPGGFVIDTAEDVLSPGSWHYIEFRFFIADAADDGAIEVIIDGTSVMLEEEIDTNNALSTAFYELRMQHVATTGTAQDFAAYDDIYIDKGGAALGPCRVRSLPPNADVEAGWEAEPSIGPHYTTVNENGADSADYVQADVNGVRERYNIANTTELEDIVSFKLEVEAINTEGGSPSLELEIAAGGSTITESVALTTTTDFTVFDFYTDSSPGGGAWTPTSVDDAKVGVVFRNNLQ